MEASLLLSLIPEDFIKLETHPDLIRSSYTLTLPSSHDLHTTDPHDADTGTLLNSLEYTFLLPLAPPSPQYTIISIIRLHMKNFHVRAHRVTKNMFFSSCKEVSVFLKCSFQTFKREK